MKTIGDKCSGKDIREPRPEEAIARDMIAPFVDGTLVSIADPPDFALCRNGELVGWAEVTTAVDGERLALDNWIKKNDFSFTSGELSHDWTVIPHKTAKLDRLDRGTLVALLGDWEAYHTDPDGFISVWDHPPITQLMRLVGIEWLQFVPPLQREATVSITTPPFGGAVGPSLINDLATEKGIGKAKALAGRRGERHLIVLVSYDYPTAVGLALTDHEAPDEPPELPDEITHVWLSAVRSLLWHYSSEVGRWVIIETATN